MKPTNQILKSVEIKDYEFLRHIIYALLNSARNHLFIDDTEDTKVEVYNLISLIIELLPLEEFKELGQLKR